MKIQAFLLILILYRMEMPSFKGKKIDPGAYAGILQKTSRAFLMLSKLYQSQQQPSTIFLRKSNAVEMIWLSWNASGCL